MYLWQAPDWPLLHFDALALQSDLAAARVAQGRVLGLASSLQLVELGALQLEGWALEALATAQIEGEVLQLNSVRASAARRLGLPGAADHSRDARTEATLDVLQAAVAQWPRALCADDLWGWHAALFPTGRSGMTRIVVGGWRTHPEPMQIVTPRLGQPDLIHYQAPDSADVPAMMAALIDGFNQSQGRIDGLVRAALAHLWFETIHPFEDGNGRVGRALVELALAQDMQSGQRLFSLSQQLWLDRAGYYAQLQSATGQPDLDATPWVRWFVGRVEQACLLALDQMQMALRLNRFHAWLHVTHPQLGASQRKVLVKLLELGPGNFVGGLSTEKYGHWARVSRATAYRDLTELVELGLLERTGTGRGTRYQLRALPPD